MTLTDDNGRFVPLLPTTADLIALIVKNQDCIRQQKYGFIVLDYAPGDAAFKLFPPKPVRADKKSVDKNSLSAK